jgi:hypothetical protein
MQARWLADRVPRCTGKRERIAFADLSPPVFSGIDQRTAQVGVEPVKTTGGLRLQFCPLPAGPTLRILRSKKRAERKPRTTRSSRRDASSAPIRCAVNLADACGHPHSRADLQGIHQRVSLLASRTDGGEWQTSSNALSVAPAEPNPCRWQSPAELDAEAL